jgi:HAD superfamily hydrolase (TIGR01509 family)
VDVKPTRQAVLFDYGLTLVTFSFPRDDLLEAMRTVRPLLGPGAPSPDQLVDGVLTDADRRLGELDGSLDEIDYLDFFEQAWCRAGFALSRETLYRILDEEQRCWDRAARVAPDALPTLEELRRRGLRTAVCSNAPFPPEMIRRQMSHLGIAQRVDVITLSAEVGRRKPAREVYLAALDMLDVLPARALFVGDRRREDFDGPRAVGMDAVLCTELIARDTPPAVPTIPTLAGVLELVS